MGAYINHPDKTKEEWLRDNALEISRGRALEHNDFDDLLLVVLVRNPAFSAAAIAYSPSEKTVFLEPRDPRPRRYFIAAKDDLLKVSAGLRELTRR